MTPTDYLQQLQAEAEPSGYHKPLRAWVDAGSGVARVLEEMPGLSPDADAVLLWECWAMQILIARDETDEPNGIEVMSKAIAQFNDLRSRGIAHVADADALT